MSVDTTSFLDFVGRSVFACCSDRNCPSDNDAASADAGVSVSDNAEMSGRLSFKCERPRLLCPDSEGLLSRCVHYIRDEELAATARTWKLFVYWESSCSPLLPRSTLAALLPEVFAEHTKPIRSRRELCSNAVLTHSRRV